MKNLVKFLPNHVSINWKSFDDFVMFSKDKKLREDIESYLLNELHERNVLGRYSSETARFFFNLFAQDILMRLKLNYWKHL